MATFKQRYAPKIPSKKYLKHPLGSHDFKITEGFLYSSQESSIHKFFFHRGIDYACDYGTAVYSAASGYAVASYHRGILRDKDDTVLMYKGIPATMGMGYFVQIFHPEKICGVKNGRITQYGHLSGFAPKIKYKKMPRQEIDFVDKIYKLNNAKRSNKKSKQTMRKVLKQTEQLCKKYTWLNYRYGYNYDEDINKRESYFYRLTELERLLKQNDKYVTWVEQGDLIGYTGTSAIFWGKPPYDEEMTSVKVPKFKTWDEPHLHFEEATRNPEKMTKELARDPYGIYKSAKWYRHPDIGRSLLQQ